MGENKVLDEIIKSFDQLAVVGISCGLLTGAVYPSAMNHFNDLLVGAGMASSQYRDSILGFFELYNEMPIIQALGSSGYLTIAGFVAAAAATPIYAPIRMASGRFLAKIRKADYMRVAEP
jgi:hypothetical protein